jgi:hypothetical protein
MSASLRGGNIDGSEVRDSAGDGLIMAARRFAVKTL